MDPFSKMLLEPRGSTITSGTFLTMKGEMFLIEESRNTNVEHSYGITLYFMASNDT